MRKRRCKLIRLKEIAVTELTCAKTCWQNSKTTPTSVEVVAEKYNAYMCARNVKRKLELDIIDSGGGSYVDMERSKGARPSGNGGTLLLYFAPVLLLYSRLSKITTGTI